ncbi:hypothetical protein AUC43_17155 [Hymenobacter sedentarius]|uniref:UDP-N-acetyl glucosamine 2-epimerase n=1 Tax=Hymenobacter sedentarius TaxID=1411621 RepID=A0A0U4CTB2_9BACT|nr:hypothetical protein [Hymenobacter sedentarius]ALW86654.1 hypothetical protein AUC43_17155 [Hymenobacter sedentarius]
MSRKKVLFLIGSPNQTTQMHQIAQLLADEFDPYFSQLYYDGWQRGFYRFLLKTGGLDKTIVTGAIKAKADKYLAQHGLANDFEARQYGNTYDLLVCCSDVIVPWPLVRRTKTIFVQEGMTDPLNWWARLIRKLNWMPILAIGTALNGLANCCDIYCVASEGYKAHFAYVGVDRDKLVVTGIPNFDDAEKLRHNDFPHHGYVLVATSDLRETFTPDNRQKFIAHCTRIAAGRPMIFKLHPNEQVDRAVAEIKRYAPPGTLVYTEGNTDHMIANCVELITQYSTVVYVGLALGKPVHSYFDVEDLKRKQPWQNGGTSARRIAAICRGFSRFEGSGPAFLRQYQPEELSSSAPADGSLAVH